jgi:hypothetical protein
MLKMQNKPKAPPQKVDADGHFQFDENCQHNTPARITGVMLISPLGNVTQAIVNLLIELKGDAHQIRYKPTQQKNSKAEKMFPGIPAGLCSEGIMRSI